MYNYDIESWNSMPSESLTIINKLGLHARAAAKLAEQANRYACQIELTANDQTVDCKSIMSLMLLAAGKGTPIELHTRGSDEELAMEAITNLINDYFGEGE